MNYYSKSVTISVTYTQCRQFLAYFVSIVIIAAMIFSLILVPVWTKPAFGDSLTQEQLTALGNRKADLLIKMTPPVVTRETMQKGQKPVVELDYLTQIQTSWLSIGNTESKQII